MNESTIHRTDLRLSKKTKLGESIGQRQTLADKVTSTLKHAGKIALTFGGLTIAGIIGYANIQQNANGIETYIRSREDIQQGYLRSWENPAELIKDSSGKPLDTYSVILFETETGERKKDASLLEQTFGRHMTPVYATGNQARQLENLKSKLTEGQYAKVSAKIFWDNAITFEEARERVDLPYEQWTNHNPDETSSDIANTSGGGHLISIKLLGTGKVDKKK